jgi:SAM-dependent methyltransferase
MSTTPYDALAPYYDALHGALTADVDFVLARAREQAGAVLELGCGTGRLLVPLAQAGVSVTGIDASAAMLARARQRIEAAALPPARVRLVEAEMTGFALPTHDYTLILVAYNTFFHLDPAAAVTACRRARAHAVRGARLFIDITSPFLMEEADTDGTVTLERALQGAGEESLVLVFTSSRLDATAQQLNVTWLFDASAREGGPVRRTVVEERYHYYYPHQVELILEESGFRLRKLLGDYDGRPFAEDSERLLVLAEAV